MEIQLTLDEKKYLKLFAEKQYEGAPDNLGTMTPIHVVERIDRTFIPCDEEEYWIDADNECAEYDTFDDLIEARRKNGEKLPDYEEMVFERVGGRYIMDKQDYCHAFGINAYSGRYVYSSRPVAFFLIRSEAERYAKGYQAHNCEGCRIYTYGLGYSNKGDLPVLRALLMRMGKQLAAQPEVATE